VEVENRRLPTLRWKILPPSSGKMKMLLKIGNHLEDQWRHELEHGIIQSVKGHGMTTCRGRVLAEG
jgi:hypothetical protein